MGALAKQEEDEEKNDQIKKKSFLHSYLETSKNSRSYITVSNMTSETKTKTLTMKKSETNVENKSFLHKECTDLSPKYSPVVVKSDTIENNQEEKSDTNYGTRVADKKAVFESFSSSSNSSSSSSSPDSFKSMKKGETKSQ